jgi:low affinity Fe/Cu permease
VGPRRSSAGQGRFSFNGQSIAIPAIHAKLDEILRSTSAASNITRINDEELEEIEEHRSSEQQGD